MEVTKGTLKHETRRDSYWTRLSVKSPERKQTFVYVCASHEYLGSEFKTNDFDTERVSQWVDTVAQEWTTKGSSIFNKPFHLEVRAMTHDGYTNGVNFLKEEIIPISKQA